MMQSGITQAREFDDPPGLHEKTEYLLREWVGMYHLPTAGRDSTKAFSAFVGQVRSYRGILGQVRGQRERSRLSMALVYR